MPNAQIIIVVVPPLNSRDRNTASGTIGCVARFSTARKTPAATAATANAATICVDVQPWSCPSISA